MKLEREDEIKKDIRVFSQMANDPKYKNNNIGRAYRLMTELKIKELNLVKEMCENNGKN
jgi:hypothetical protein